MTMTQAQDSASPFNAPPLAELLKNPPSGSPEAAMVGLFNSAFGIGCSLSGMAELLRFIGNEPACRGLRNIPHFGKLVVRLENPGAPQPVYSFRWPDKPTVYVQCERQKDNQLLLVGWRLKH
jgi:hypothetical protein